MASAPTAILASTLYERGLLDLSVDTERNKHNSLKDAPHGWIRSGSVACISGEAGTESRARDGVLGAGFEPRLEVLRNVAGEAAGCGVAVAHAQRRGRLLPSAWICCSATRPVAA